MSENKTPDWLIDIQNKSWEPEILISGISLTIIFLLQDHIYNFNAMLIQDFGFPRPIGMGTNLLSLVTLNAVKVSLVIHLALRGLWTGLVGLSYVFPKGVQEDKLPKSIVFRNYESPQELIMKVEKICSLLFSFIFTFIFYLLTMLTLYLPLLIALYFVNDLSIIESVLWVFIILVFSTLALVTTIFKKSKIKRSMEHSLFSHISYIYSTNMGKGKTAGIFISFIILVFFFTFPSIFKFNFGSSKSVNQRFVNENIIRNKLYKSLRNNNLRFERAVISDFNIKDSYTNLYISRYKYDEFHVQKSNENLKSFADLKGIANIDTVKQTDIYTIYLNEKKLDNLTWFKSESPETNQDIFFATIKLDSIRIGQNFFRVDKVHWHVDDEKLKVSENWEYIPFQKL